MIKITTLFKKNPANLGLVISELAPGNEWVTPENAIPTRKRDGSSVLIKEGSVYKRLDVKGKRVAPANAIPCQPYPDPQSGHHPHWLPCSRENPADKYIYEGYDALEQKDDGTYELCGPKIASRELVNGENLDRHILYKHASEILDIADFSFESLRNYLSNPELDIEGIVFHHKTDGRMCKIRKRDFGIKRR